MDIVLLPPKALSLKIGRLVLLLGRKFPLAFAVDDRKLLPHISLLHLKVNRKQLKKVIKEVKLLSEKHQKMTLRFGSGYAGSRFFCVEIQKTPRLYSLHQGAVKSISRFRSGITRLPEKAKNQTQKDYFQKYGVANILNFFNPHITLGMLKSKNHQDAVLKTLAAQSLPKFTASRLAVAKVNNYHQVTKVIKNPF